MRFVRVAALAALPSLALLSSNAFAASGCWYPNEAKAAQLRDFHAMLMVGTLQCRSTNASAIQRYNEFVSAQRGILDANAQVLKARFLREDGIQQGQGAYDRYATSLANQQSQRSIDPGFCGSVDTFVRMATAASQADLLVLAQSVSQAPESGACPPSNYSAYDAAKPAPTTAPTTTVAATAPKAAAAGTAPEAETALAEVAAKSEADVAGAPAAAIVAPAPAKAVAVAQTTTEAPAAPATPSRDEALKAAVIALQSAATALQAASAAGAPAEASPEAKAQTVAAVKVEDAPVVPPKEVTTP